jgi:type I restriction enzyme, R subunit
MAGFSEKSLAEDYLDNQLQLRGWKYVAADDLERESLEEPLLTSALVRSIKSINAGADLGDAEILQLLNELKLRAPGAEGSKQILEFLKHGVPIKFEKDKVVKYVQLFDYADLKRNDFILSRQVWFRAGEERIRADIVLFVNGVPLVIIECKDPANPTTTWVDAYEQIKDYEVNIAELFKYLQIGVAAEQVARYFPIVPFAEDVNTYEWKSGHKDSLESIIDFLAPHTLMDIIRNYLFVRIERGQATKVIVRYMQYRAAEKVAQRALSYAKGQEHKNRGLVWHWQGSGKTLTMIFAAHKLYENPDMSNPTVFFIVDREELEEQLYQECGALDMHKPEVIASIDHLRKVIRHDNGRGKRGIFITLIHKFQADQLLALHKELLALGKAGETISQRKNIVAFIDEGHRTQYGLLAAQMREMFKAASVFAFTGTPIAKEGRDTYQEFSYPKDEAHLDKYFITDSIKDGFTLRIVYQPRLEKGVHLQKELLDTFLEVEFEEITEDIREKVKDQVKKKINLIRVVLKNPDRVTQVAEDIVTHFKENVDGRFKAMIVAVDREACVQYKRALDTLLPKEYSEVVMTYTQGDPAPVADYLAELRERFPGKDVPDINKTVVERFKEDQNPRILIVTEMLLTGFDAPILQTMYLDKPLKEHRLLQAIARTNRPLKDLKKFGVIIDYVGILKEVHRAFELYSKEDIKGALQNISELSDEFAQKLNAALEPFKDIPKDEFSREIMLRAIKVITASEATSKKFLQDVKELRHLFELLGPAAVKVVYVEEYKWLTSVFNYYVILVRRDTSEALPVEKYFQKTLKYIYKSTELEKLNRELPEIKFDENYIRALDEKVKSKEEKAANIVFALNRFVLTDKQRSPVYESLVDKVGRLVQRWREKTKDFESIYREGVELFGEIQELSAKQRKLGFSDAEFGILIALEGGVGKKGNLVEDVRELFTSLKDTLFPGWVNQSVARKNVERTIRKYLRKYMKEHGLTLKAIDTLNEKILEAVKQHAA